MKLFNKINKLLQKNKLSDRDKIKLIKSEQELKDVVINLQEQIRDLNEEILSLQSDITTLHVGLLEPIFEYDTSEEYKEKLLEIRARQKESVKNNTACVYPDHFLYDNDPKKGAKLVKDNVKQILRSFNNECDVLISKVKYNNLSVIKSRIQKSFEILNKLNEKMHIAITYKYLDLKNEELEITYKLEKKKQEEKERAKEERERLREEAKVQKEIEEKRKSINKEKSHYTNALNKIVEKLKNSPNDTELASKKEELEKQLKEIEINLKDIDYRENNKRAGYVYIISNIGSFGENIYKIGMTRRLEPLDRVHELGDASVPFNFDIHALIFSDDAPTLENSLHKAFEDKKVNMINSRREFFNCTLEEIEEVVKNNFEKTVEFIKEPPAEQYRETLLIKTSAVK